MEQVVQAILSKVKGFVFHLGFEIITKRTRTAMVGRVGRGSNFGAELCLHSGVKKDDGLLRVVSTPEARMSLAFYIIFPKTIRDIL